MPGLQLYGFTSKLHCLADAPGRPVALHLTDGEAADCNAYDPLIALPEQAPRALLADKGYDADAIRTHLVRRNTLAVIPGSSNRWIKIEHDRTLYKARNHIERFFGRLKVNPAIATRYDQLTESFLSIAPIAEAGYWLKFDYAAQRLRAKDQKRHRVAVPRLRPAHNPQNRKSLIQTSRFMSQTLSL